jgi:hypothetical protein
MRLEKISGASDRESRNRNTLNLESEFPIKERARLTDDLQTELNGLVYRYFGLTQQEIALVEDMMEVVIPSSTPHDWWSEENVFTLDSVQKARPIPYRPGIEVYAITLTQTLNGWAVELGSTHRVAATGGYDQPTGLAMVTLRLTETVTGFQEAGNISDALWKTLESYRRHASRRRQGTLAEERDIVLYQGKNIHIVRPGILANWTRTAALNDAARIYGEIALSKEGE